jgi:hypothetical protein
VTISFHLHSELDVLMDSVLVVKQVSQLGGSMWQDDERIINITKLAEGLVGGCFQSHSFKALHEIVSNDWGKGRTHRKRPISILSDSHTIPLSLLLWPAPVCH